MPTNVSVAQDELGAAVEIYLDSGELISHGVSTIIDLTGDVPCLLREGTLTVEKVRQVVPNLVIETG
jgi:tRNA A37 threonylcarbamoyladenosine synthetase subunit TsaC/SUA5/YrdC